MGYSQGVARLLSLETGECKVLSSRCGAVVSGSVSLGACITGYANCTARVWHADGSSVALCRHRGPVLTVALSTDLALTGSSDELAKLWCKRSGACLRVLEGHRGIVTCSCFHATQPVTGSFDGTVKLWGSQTQSLELCSPVSALATDGRLLAAGAHDGKVHLYNEGERVELLEGFEAVRSLSLSQGQVLWADALAARFWDVETRKQRQIIQEAIFSVMLRPE